jgi:hypothetical protein
MAASISEPDWAGRVMPSVEAIQQVFSAPVMARDVLKLYTEILGQSAYC